MREKELYADSQTTKAVPMEASVQAGLQEVEQTYRLFKMLIEKVSTSQVTGSQYISSDDGVQVIEQALTQVKELLETQISLIGFDHPQSIGEAISEIKDQTAFTLDPAKLLHEMQLQKSQDQERIQALERQIAEALDTH